MEAGSLLDPSCARARGPEGACSVHSSTCFPSQYDTLIGASTSSPSSHPLPLQSKRVMAVATSQLRQLRRAEAKLQLVERALVNLERAVSVLACCSLGPVLPIHCST